MNNSSDSIRTKCAKCDDPISVPAWDKTNAGYYCYTCAMNKLGAIPNAGEKETL